jgi:ABC-type phosphate/phosphonate transport system substrate-binding protein
VFQRLAKANPRILEELVVLARSPDVPENGLALRKDIGLSLRNRVKETLLTMHLDPDGRKVLERFGALKFIETTDKDYDVVRAYAKRVHLDLATYEYMNN